MILSCAVRPATTLSPLVAVVARLKLTKHIIVGLPASSALASAKRLLRRYALAFPLACRQTKQMKGPRPRHESPWCSPNKLWYTCTPGSKNKRPGRGRRAVAQSKLTGIPGMRMDRTLPRFRPGRPANRGALPHEAAAPVCVRRSPAPCLRVRLGAGHLRHHYVPRWLHEDPSIRGYLHR